jgi:hypothetical protein
MREKRTNTKCKRTARREREENKITQISKQKRTCGYRVGIGINYQGKLTRMGV